jgi:4-aminobutyrate aminotransferase-like enzyme
MNSLDYESLSRQHVLHAVQREKTVIFERAENARLWDVDGKMYLDTMSGSAGPAMVGHSNSLVAAAIGRQAAKLPSVNLLHDSTTAIEFCTRLASIAPAGLSKCFICPGGGEAVEAAVKFAIHVTGRSEILSLTGAYHGMSLATMSLGGMPGIRSWFPGATRWPTFRQVPSADAYRPPLGETGDIAEVAISALVSSLEAGGFNQPAALLLELVQGPNGHAVFPRKYYREVQRICRERNVLLIVDEIQTGLGRCGAMWACDVYDVQPDILIAGKALGGGMPIGAFIVRPELVKEGLESQPWHMLTFMNQPLIAAAGLAVLEIIEREELVERARMLGERATARFKKMATQYDVIGDVRGPGLFIGIDFVENSKTKAPATAACRAAWNFALGKGLITQFGGMGSNVYKFKPPLTTPLDDFDRMLAISEEVVAFIQEAVDLETTRVPAGVAPASAGPL